MCGGRGVKVGIKSQEDGGKEKQKCKITNMSHHRIHVHNIYFCYNLHFQAKGS